MRTLTALLTLALASRSIATSPQTLPAFTGVQVCTPFNVAIAPSSGSSYTLTVDADADVASAVQTSVQSNVLSLSSSGSFNTQQPIKVTVGLPASKLAGVEVSSAAGITVAVQPGFTTSTLNARLLGGGLLNFADITATSVKLLNTGTGNLVFNGSANTATVQTSGTGMVYVAGVSEQVAVSAQATGNVLINSPSNSLKITGRVNGISNLRYNKGVCSATASGLARACIRSTVTPPSSQLQWSCGLQQSGSFTCQSSGGDSTTYSTGNGGGTSSSSSGSGSYSSSSSSSSGGNGGFYYSSSSGPNGNTVTSSNPSGQGSNTLTTDTGSLQSQTCTAAANTLSIS